MSIDLRSGDYENFLHGLKERIRHAQIQAALAVNRELVMLYWQIGQGNFDAPTRAGLGRESHQ